MINLNYLFHIFECGHFCIKKFLKQDKIKLNVKYNRKMMSLGLVARVLEEYYQRVECYEVGDISLVKERCITLLNVGKNKKHYVVVERISDDYVYYYDPFYFGTRKLKKEKFIVKWSGYCCFASKK